MMTALPTARPGLLCHKLDDELLVYDPKEDQIHLLNVPTFEVLEMLQRESDREAILDRLHASRSTAEDMLALAIDELARAGLLDSHSQASRPQVITDMNRRAMVQRIAIAASALLVPAIITLSPKSASAQSNTPDGSACTTSSQCITHCCSNSNGANCGNQKNVCRNPVNFPGCPCI